MIKKNTLTYLGLFTTMLAFIVITVGAYVRLSDAGLGCPDWPGCYGRLVVPMSEAAQAAANSAYPERPVHVGKAWKEMVHRYVASGLGLLILVLAGLAWMRRFLPNQMVVLPFVLVGLVIFQGILGMWTVTWLLKPTVVTAHLLGGMVILALLWWFTLRQSGWFIPYLRLSQATPTDHLQGWALVGVGLVLVQIGLGGWTSSNYAALSCPDFPTCQGYWLPPLGNVGEAFTLWHGLGVDYTGGILPPDVRLTVHFVHRVGALVVLLYLTGLCVYLLRQEQPYDEIKWAAGVVLVALFVQVSLGVANVLYALPLSLAVAHNGMAALLLLAVVTLNHVLRPLKPQV